MISIPIHQLGASARPALQEHFLGLAPEDRRLRFGIALGDQSILDYLDSIDFERDDVFGVYDECLELIGVAHLSIGDNCAELGLSVSGGQRGRGVGSALLRRAHERARNRFVNRLFVHCLAENDAMLHLARRAGMRLLIEYGDADAMVSLPPADGASLAGEMWEQHVAMVDFALKAQMRALHRLNDGLCEPAGST
jgi:GNAT superfamily N-acetyltransferase